MVVKKFDYSLTMAADIIAIDRETFQDITMSKEVLCQTLSNWKNYDIYISYINDKATGFIGLMKAITPHYQGWWIDLLAVIPEKQGNGIGSKLIAFAKENYKTEDNVITALIRKNNGSSIKAAERNGFKTDMDINFGLFSLD